MHRSSSGKVRQTTNADEHIRKQLHLAMDDNVGFLDEPMHRPRWFEAGHNLEK
jgi:hypothetical protein